MHKHALRRAMVVVTLLIALFGQETWALAGTTGRLTGTVSDQSTGAPIAGASVTVTSPSQTTTATTDAGGHFAFVSLAPDTYTLTSDKNGYQTVSQAGISIFADQTQTVALQMPKALRTIATVTSRAAGALVKSGTTADVYSVNAATAGAVSALGGGGSLNSAYSAIAAVPGTYVPQGQSGWAQSVYVRGANYTQLGYEFDGVPVQRSFDQYPATTLSALGQQELQVYTGAAPANAQSGAIGGFINQVIKTGTYPGYGTLKFGLGSPTFYHQAVAEAGGASPNRLFSYYFGLAGYNQDFRYASQFNGANIDQTFGSPYNLVASGCGTPQASVGCYANHGGFFGAFPVGPAGIALGPLTAGTALTSMLADREAVANLHFGIPHKNDAGRDDIQLLYDVSFLRTQYPTATNDWNYATNNVLNGTATINGVTYPNCGSVAAPGTADPCAVLPGIGIIAPGQSYIDSSVYTGPVGQALSGSALGAVQNYFQPGSPQNRAAFSPTPPDERDFYSNNSAIAKLQYQKNIGSNAYFRVYGYTFYSDWLQQSLSGATLTENFVGVLSPDYSVITHTTGVVGQFADQLNAQHLLTVTGGYTHANTIRWNNAWYAASPTVAVAVNSSDPTNGICYSFTATPGTTTPVPCSAASAGRYVLPGAGGTSLAPAHPADPLVGAIGASNCGGAPCEYFTVNAGYRGTYNTVVPQFTNASAEDTWRPNDKFVVNLGLHYDDFKYGLADTTQAPSFLGLGGMAAARTLFANSFTNWYCFSQATGLVASTAPHSCPAGTTGVNWTNASPSANDYHAWEPRVGMTYTVNPLNVIRASWGKYEQPASSAFQQYQNANNDLPLTAPANSFYPLGFTGPTHQVFPEESFNSDLSWEHQVKGSDLSWKITPFYRHTRNEIFNVLLDPKTNFVSGVNVGRKDVYGVELAVQKGDFNRNGWAGLLSYTYTGGRVHFDTLQNGTTVLTGVNSAISQYNAYTSKCAPFQANPSNTSGVPAQCLTPPVPGVAQTVALPSNGAAAAPCYTSAGAPDATCAGGSIANPYWNAPAQGLFNANDAFVPYNQLPGTGVSSVASSYIIPHVAALVVNYRMNKFAVTPQFQIAAGGKYGSQVQGQGIDPATCTGALTSGITGDP
ncbi:MAG TPA: TonB-dependent receptor, partial [Candidatus Baltobacteraceae bacterium]|nr:TonB-dependent receptor [Candidatus Baltobacteraceae bacterium]